jgi:hypothetical protein
MRFCKKYLLLFLLFLPLFSSAQGTFVPLDREIYHIIDRFHVKYGDKVPELHTGIRPFRRLDIAKLAEETHWKQSDLSAADKFNKEYLLNDNWDYTTREARTAGQPFLKHFFRNKADLFHVDDEDYSIRLNPVLHFQVAKDSDTEGMRYINTRGVQVEGNINKRLGFYTFLADNQAKFAGYVNERIQRDTIVPNEGYYKPFKETGYDFITARGYINYGLSKNINVQFGHDKNFIGNGYRSLVLSDYTAPYFFLKLNTNIWKLHYMNLFAEMNSDFEFRDQLLPKKYFAYHHLSLNLTPAINIGLFESVIFSRGKGRFELQYLNPIIFYRSVEQQLGSNDNALLGFDFKANILKTAQLYGQVMLDEFLLSEVRAGNGWWANKQSFQVGAKYFDVAGIPNLDAQGEINFIRPYTYQHEDQFTNYQHYRQPLAHPMGANLSEFIGILRYQPTGKLMLTGKALFTKYGVDTDSSNWGSNVLLSYNNHPYAGSGQREYGHQVGQGNTTKLLHLDLTASWQLRHNMFIDVKQILRRRQSELASLTNNVAFTSVSFRWNIPQRLHEF